MVELEVTQGDITTIAVDAIVNAANAALGGGGGVDGAIHRAGGPEILDECRRIGRCPTGGAVITGAGKLPARWVIHAVAPIYRGRAEDAVLLASAYRESLRRAAEVGATSIAFPSLGTGAYGYPIREAAPIAIATVREHGTHATPLERVLFVLFNRTDYLIYQDMLRAG